MCIRDRICVVDGIAPYAVFNRELFFVRFEHRKLGMIEELSAAAHLDALERLSAEFVYRIVRALSHAASALYHGLDPEGMVLPVADHLFHIRVAVMPYACGVGNDVVFAEESQFLVLDVVAV